MKFTNFENSNCPPQFNIIIFALIVSGLFILAGCATLPTKPVCSNNICETGEDSYNCPQDCGTPTTPVTPPTPIEAPTPTEPQISPPEGPTAQGPPPTANFYVTIPTVKYGADC